MLHAAIVEQIGDQTIRSNPNFICWEGTFKEKLERYIKQDPCLSICFLLKEDYVEYTRGQRIFSMVGGVVLFITVAVNSVYDEGPSPWSKDPMGNLFSLFLAKIGATLNSVFINSVFISRASRDSFVQYPWCCGLHSCGWL
eukprot:SAG11_NODE_2501_length_3281_cov_1.563168_1_plen_141_part_00